MIATQQHEMRSTERMEQDRANLAMALRLPHATAMPELLDRVRNVVADLGAFDAQATGLAYFLAEQLGEHVDDQGDETQTQTVKRLLDKVRSEPS